MKLVLDNKLNIFQTLEHRNNHKEVEEHGPYICTRSDAWLGYGYYFWDSSIDNAHSWGRGYESKGKYYYITCCEADLNGSNCFNLLEPKNKILFDKIVDKMCEGFNKNRSEIIVLDVIKFLKKKSNEFRDKYLAIKVQSSKRVSKVKEGVKFSKSKKSSDYFDTQSFVQICVFEDSNIPFENFKIVFDSKTKRIYKKETSMEGYNLYQ